VVVFVLAVLLLRIQLASRPLPSRLASPARPPFGDPRKREFEEPLFELRQVSDTEDPTRHWHGLSTPIWTRYASSFFPFPDPLGPHSLVRTLSIKTTQTLNTILPCHSGIWPCSWATSSLAVLSSPQCPLLSLLLRIAAPKSLPNQTLSIPITHHYQSQNFCYYTSNDLRIENSHALHHVAP
jgi:hypothetical protein